MNASGLRVVAGHAPVVISIPHAGTDLADLEPRLVSPWLARKDTDWWIAELYDFAAEMGATVVRSAISRTVIDVNRDPSGQTLYPGQSTTALCPTTTFDGEPLYISGHEPDAAEAVSRRERWHDPYHAALARELARLRAIHGQVVLYDCHSIRSVIPRLFEGTLPAMNLGTFDGASADPALVAQVAAVMAASGRTQVTNGRFKGGYITRHHGRPAAGVHALQMELACRTYLAEPEEAASHANWPPAYDSAFAAPMRATLQQILAICQDFAAVRS